MRTDIFSVTVAIEEEKGKFFWTSLKEHQNIQFTEVLTVCQQFKFWRVSMFDEKRDLWIEIAVNE